MHEAASIELVSGDWEQLGPDAARIRDAVFVREQGIPPELEWDEEDASSVHVVAYVLVAGWKFLARFVAWQLTQVTFQICRRS